MRKAMLSLMMLSLSASVASQPVTGSFEEPKRPASVQGLMAALKSQDWRVRREAAAALGELAPDSKKVVVALRGTLSDSESRVRRSAARALGDIGPAASRAVSALVDSLRDIDPLVIQSSAEALGRIGSRASRAVTALRRLLTYDDPRVRKSAAEALGLIGRRAAKGIPELARALNDPDPSVRASAARALGQMGRRASKATRELIQLLGDEDPYVRASASEAISKFGKSAVSPLVYALQSGNPIFLQSVVDTLGLIGPPAVSALIETLNDTRDPLIARRYATLALARIGSADKKVVPALVERLDDDDADIRLSAAEALGKIGSDASASTTRLVEVSRNHNEEVIVREYAIIALSRIARDDALAISALKDAVGDGNPQIYEAAVAAMMAIGASSPARIETAENVALLVDQLEARDLDQREAAATRLGLLGPYAIDSTPALSRILNESNEARLRTAAATALGLIGPAADGAVPSLIAALEDDDPQLRRAALVALQRIGPQTRTIPALLEAMRAGDLEVRGPAAASIQNFAKARLQSWQPVLFQSDAPVLRNWLGRYHALYGIDASPNERDSRRRAFDTADFFEILGGRAAIRESVQLHLIDDPLTPPDRRREYPVESLESVRVDSHPFEKKMLKESRLPPAELPLANIVPPDHFFAYFSSLRAFRETFDGGSDLFVRLESTLSAKSIEYDQKAAYLSRLGLSESILNEQEAGGAIRGIGFVAPDLFFVDGTEITVIAELASADLVRAVLQVTGIGREANEEIAAYELELGKTVFWATRGDLLLLSTHREELQSILSLADAKLESLGRSDEFQYMLQRLPIEQDTQAYFYFSDPFIRRLVGPRTKIAQLRRMQARAEMEMLVAGALLYRLDGHHSLPTKQRLIELGYVPAYFEDRNYTVRDDLTVHSDRFGSIAELKSLRQVPIGRVSERELNAYKEFVDHYSRYWRQFFDPIAMRLNKNGDREFEATTFILPLLDSELYDEVREMLTTHENGSRLKVPELSPKPAMLLSVNVSDSRRIEISRELAGTLLEYTSINPEIFDSVGSAIHLAVQDSTPIVALGAGDVWGALSEDIVRMEGFGSFLPILLSLATQPATVLVELEEPDRVVEFLKDAVIGRSGSGGDGGFHQLQGQQAWIYTLNLENLFQLHLRVAVNDGYLMISNLPWSQRTTVGAATTASLNGVGIQLNLDAIHEQLPALHTKAFSDYRSAAVDGMGYLYPLLASGVATTVDDAMEKHLMLFGYRPVHPLSGKWLWRDGELSSSIFGTALRPVQPEFTPGDRDFGLFPTMDFLAVSMQLEESGLRARVRWRLAVE